MLHWKATYLILMIVFAVIGFIGIDETGGLEPAKYISGIFLILLVVFYFVYKRRRIP